ncbi:MAG TPA: cell division FtsA domain-containing protein, partial [bacterium]
HASSMDGREAFSTAPYGGRGHREISSEQLLAIIQPRMEEIFSLVRKELRRSEYEPKTEAGVVLTGGGALLRGVSDLAEEVFERPVRIGIPKPLGGLSETVSSPIFATGMGLVLFGLESEQGGRVDEGDTLLPNKEGWRRLWNRFRNVFSS